MGLSDRSSIGHPASARAVAGPCRNWPRGAPRPARLGLVLAACLLAGQPCARAGDTTSLSLEALRAAALQGDPTAQNALGVRYGNGAGVRKDARQAAAWFRRAAEQGDVSAQMNLGSQYLHGVGVEKDPAQGFAWLLKAAGLGQRTAQWYVGRVYLEGEGTPRDPAHAVDWLGRAALQGIETAWDDLDRLLRAGNPEALGWLRDKAEQGDMRAQVRLARAFRDGQGVNRDLIQALEWYARAGANWVAQVLHQP